MSSRAQTERRRLKADLGGKPFKHDIINDRDGAPDMAANGARILDYPWKDTCHVARPTVIWFHSTEVWLHPDGTYHLTDISG